MTNNQADSDFERAQQCLHRRLKYIKNIQTQTLTAVCLACNSAGPPIELGRFMWWARSRAASKFYKQANEFDEYSL